MYQIRIFKHYDTSKFKSVLCIELCDAMDVANGIADATGNCVYVLEYEGEPPEDWRYRVNVIYTVEPRSKDYWQRQRDHVEMEMEEFNAPLRWTTVNSFADEVRGEQTDHLSEQELNHLSEIVGMSI